jgi:hypothetical protein
MALADAYACSDRADPNADVIRQGWSSERNNSGNHQKAFHPDLPIKMLRKRGARSKVPLAGTQRASLLEFQSRLASNSVMVRIGSKQRDGATFQPNGF